MLKKTFKSLENLLIILFLIVFFLSAYFKFASYTNYELLPKFFGITPLIVLSGSMHPIINAGDVIFVKQKNTENIKPGDIVSYKVSDKIVTHRVVEVFKNNSDIMFKTKGEVNNVNDEYLVSSANLIGVMFFKIPYLGFLYNFLNSYKIGILLIGALIIIFGGEIFNHVRKNIKNKE